MSTGQAIRAEVRCRIREFGQFSIYDFQDEEQHGRVCRNKRLHLKDSQSQELFEFHLRLFTLMQVVVATRGFLATANPKRGVLK